MSARDFPASVPKTLVPFGAVVGLTAGCAAIMVWTWDIFLIAGLFLVLMLAFAFAGAILAYRLIARPTMLRVDAAGIYMKRLGVTIPWEALARIERVNWNGEVLFALVEREGGHPVFDERALLLGAAMNEKAGLPPLAISMAQYAGTVEDFEATVVAVGEVDIVGTDQEVPAPK